MAPQLTLDELLVAASTSDNNKLVKGAGRLLCAIHCGLPELTEACWSRVVRNGGVIYSVLGKSMRALIEDDEPAESFTLSQLWKAPPWSRPALEELVDTGLLPHRTSLQAAVAKTFVAVQSAVHDLIDPPGNGFLDRTNRLAEAFDQHQQALQDMAVTDPIQAFTLGAPVETQDLVDALPEQGGAVALFDLACYTDDGLLVHLVHRDQAEVMVQPVLCQEFGMHHALNLASVYRRFLLHREDGATPEEALEHIAKTLHDRIWCHLARLAGDLGLSQFIIVPDAWTRVLPHHLARVCGKEVRVPSDVMTVAHERLADLFPLEVASTVQMVAINQWQMRPPRIERIAIFADPLGDLPSARNTASWMRERLPAEAAGEGALKVEIFEGGAATNDSFTTALAECELLVYAGHGNFIQGDVVDASLDLADGNWSIGDLQRGGVRQGSVQILAACEVGAGVTGESPAAQVLPGALVARGSATVMAALWVVEDLSFGYLTERFLHYLSHPGYRPSAALFRAMNDLKTWSRADAQTVVRERVEAMERSGADTERADEYAPLAETLAWLEDEAQDPPFASPLYWGAATVFGGGWSWPAGAYVGGADAVIDEIENMLQAQEVQRAITEGRFQQAWERTCKRLKKAHGPGRIAPLCEWAEIELGARSDRRLATLLLTRARLLAEVHDQTDHGRGIEGRLEQLLAMET